MILRFLAAAVSVVLVVPAVTAPVSAQTLDPSVARRYLREAREIARRDGGALWGRSLEAPILLVDPGTRELLTDEADSAGVLSAKEGLHAGSLPASENVFNGPIRWAGRTWAMLKWPLPSDSLERRALLAHELWHRIQPLLGIPAGNPSNPHLSTHPGRVWMRLEGRALMRAVSDTGAGRAQAQRDAAAFRRHRRALSPTADSTERALERNEGLAEDTGVRLAAPSDSLRLLMVQRRLRELDTLAGFERAFPYRTGPAYGFLLDQLRSGWRRVIAGGSDLAELALGSVTAGSEEALEARGARYGLAEVDAEEDARERARIARAAELRRMFVDGPVLELPLADIKVSFDPGRVETIDGAGTVYEVLRLVDRWGVLTVETGGGLIAADWTRAFVPAPAGRDARPLEGRGWTLDLAAGWRLVPGSRDGSWRAERVP